MTIHRHFWRQVLETEVYLMKKKPGSDVIEDLDAHTVVSARDWSPSQPNRRKQVQMAIRARGETITLIIDWSTILEIVAHESQMFPRVQKE